VKTCVRDSRYKIRCTKAVRYCDIYLINNNKYLIIKLRHSSRRSTIFSIVIDETAGRSAIIKPYRNYESLTAVHLLPYNSVSLIIFALIISNFGTRQFLWIVFAYPYTKYHHEIMYKPPSVRIKYTLTYAPQGVHKWIAYPIIYVRTLLPCKCPTYTYRN